MVTTVCIDTLARFPSSFAERAGSEDPSSHGVLWPWISAGTLRRSDRGRSALRGQRCCNQPDLTRADIHDPRRRMNSDRVVLRLDAPWATFVSLLRMSKCLSDCHLSTAFVTSMSRKDSDEGVSIATQTNHQLHVGSPCNQPEFFAKRLGHSGDDAGGLIACSLGESVTVVDPIGSKRSRVLADLECSQPCTRAKGPWVRKTSVPHREKGEESNR